MAHTTGFNSQQRLQCHPTIEQKIPPLSRFEDICTLGHGPQSARFGRLYVQTQGQVYPIQGKQCRDRVDMGTSIH